MGIDGIENLTKPDEIVDMQNFIRARQRKGQTAKQIQENLQSRGYDFHAARAFVMMYWEPTAEDE